MSNFISFFIKHYGQDATEIQIEEFKKTNNFNIFKIVIEKTINILQNIEWLYSVRAFNLLFEVSIYYDVFFNLINTPYIELPQKYNQILPEINKMIKYEKSTNPNYLLEKEKRDTNKFEFITVFLQKYKVAQVFDDTIKVKIYNRIELLNFVLNCINSNENNFNAIIKCITSNVNINNQFKLEKCLTHLSRLDKTKYQIINTSNNRTLNNLIYDFNEIKNIIIPEQIRDYNKKIQYLTEKKMLDFIFNDDTFDEVFVKLIEKSFEEFKKIVDASITPSAINVALIRAKRRAKDAFLKRFNNKIQEELELYTTIHKRIRSVIHLSEALNNILSLISSSEQRHYIKYTYSNILQG